MARNDQARPGPLGSEDAPDRWCTKGRRTPLWRPGPLGVLGPKFTTSYIAVQGACDHQLFCDYGQCLTVTGFGRG